MSLTSELKNTDSAVRAFLDGVSAPLASTYGNTKRSQAAAQRLGFTDLIDHEVLVPLAEGVDAPRSGTAFDIRTRMALGNFDLENSVSAMGLDAIIQQTSSIQNGDHRVRVMTDLYEEAQRLVARSLSEDDLDLASLLLAPPEQFFRANSKALSGSLGDALDAAEDGQAFVENLAPQAIADIRNLRIANAEQIDCWREQIEAGEPFEGNPSFAGALLVGGADGDWLAGETLVDCKVYAKLTVAKLRDFLRQLLGYTMLDLDDALKIRSLGMWLPRQATLRTWSMKALLGGDPETLLPKLREDFVKSTQHNQLAVHVPVTRQRKLQLVADNRFSPAAMLRALALGDDRDLRMRVGRNPGTPSDVTRMLSGDRYAAVREGVAGNRTAPQDVLARLLTDSSIRVRRAAAGNPASALDPNRALTVEVVADAAELVVATPLDASLETTDPVEIRQNRDPQTIDFDLLGNILSVLTEGGAVDRAVIHLPRASRVFGWRTERKPVVPEPLRRGLPNHVLEAMFERPRPPHLRRLAGRLLPIADPAVRGRLLTDSNADIRRDAFRHSKKLGSDELMGRFLAELVASRAARLAFANEGISTSDSWNLLADDEVLVGIATHPATPQASLHALMDQTSAANVLLALAGNPVLDEGGLDILAERMLAVRSVDSRQMFAQSSDCPDIVLEELARNRSEEIRVSVARNQSTPAAVLELLAQDKEHAVRIGVLRNKTSPAALVASMVDLLLMTPDHDLLFDALWVVDRRDDVQVPDELVEDALDRLSKGGRVGDSYFRSFVASHDRASPRTLVRLAKSSVEDIRIDVAGNARTPEDTLNRLLLDESTEVRVRAARSIEANAEPDDATEAPAAEVEVATAPETSVTVTELHEMVASKRADVRQQAAYHPAITPDMLTFLAGDRRSPIVRRIVAAHPLTPAGTLRRLASESDSEIIQSLAFNAGTPIDVLADLAGRSIDLALLVAFNPDAPDEILGTLATDQDPLVQFVAQQVSATRRALASGTRVNERRELGTLGD